MEVEDFENVEEDHHKASMVEEGENKEEYQKESVFSGLT